MFVNDADEDDVRTLLLVLSQKVGEYQEEGFKAFVIFLDSTPEQLQELNEKLKIDNVGLCLLTDEERDKTLEGYGISESAQTTVLLYNSRVVEDKIVNFDAGENVASLKEAIDKLCR